MESRVGGQLGVERRGKQASLLRRNDAPVFERGKHLRVPMNRFNDGCADEDRVIGMVYAGGFLQLLDIEVGLERIHLPAKSIALDGNVHQPKQGLVRLRILRKKDCSGAGSPNGM